MEQRSGKARAGHGSRPLGWGARLVLVFLLLVGTSAAALAADSVSREYQVKAAFIYNFTKFVNWPPGHFETKDEPIVLGILGWNPFGSELAAAVEGREVRGRAILVKELDSASDIESVDVVFVPAGEERLLEGAALDSAHRAGVLTIGESRRFAGEGGIITLTMQADKVRFEINRQSAASGGLRLSAQLLQLATHVRGKAGVAR